MPQGEPSSDPQGISHLPDAGRVFGFHWYCKANLAWIGPLFCKETPPHADESGASFSGIETGAGRGDLIGGGRSGSGTRSAMMVAAPRWLPLALLGLLATAIALGGGVAPGAAALLCLLTGAIGLVAASSRRLPPLSPAVWGLALLWSGVALASLIWNRHLDASLDGSAAAICASLVWMLGATLVDGKARRRFVIGLAICWGSRRIAGACRSGAGSAGLDSPGRSESPGGMAPAARQPGAGGSPLIPNRPVAVPESRPFCGSAWPASSGRESQRRLLEAPAWPLRWRSLHF